MAKCSEVIERGCDVDLSSINRKPTGSYTGNTESWQVVLSFAILQELKTLNRLLACPNFTGIPQTLRKIERNTKPKRKAGRPKLRAVA